MNLKWDKIYNKDHHFEFDDFIGTTAKTKQPKWYQDISFWRGGYKSFRELVAFNFDSVWGNDKSFKTVKGCPAYINFFKQSFALKTPCDIFIKVYQSTNADTDKKEWYWEWTTPSSDIIIDDHPEWQIGPRLAEDNIAIKFSWNYVFVADRDTQFQYVDPYIANKVHYRVSPGVVSLKKNSLGAINMVTFFEKKEEEYWIPAGSTLGYVQFDKPIKSFKRADLSKQLNRKNYLTFEKGDHNEYLAR